MHRKNNRKTNQAKTVVIFPKTETFHARKHRFFKILKRIIIKKSLYQQETISSKN